MACILQDWLLSCGQIAMTAHNPWCMGMGRFALEHWGSFRTMSSPKTVQFKAGATSTLHHRFNSPGLTAQKTRNVFHGPVESTSLYSHCTQRAVSMLNESGVRVHW